MNKTINFELVSPEEKLVSEPVTLAVIPGEEGEFGAGADHCSLVATLKPGVVVLYKEGQQDEPRRIFITGGFADVTGIQCTVLAEEAIDVSKLNAADIEQQIKDLKGDMELMTEPLQRIRIMKKINIEQARLTSVTGKIAA